MGHLLPTENKLVLNMRALYVSVERNDDGFSDEFFYIVTSKCTECIGFHDEPQCAAVCPVDCCVDDENIVFCL